MSPKTKEGNFPSVRVSPKLRMETEQAAATEQENVSEYIRKSVEMRNRRVLRELKMKGEINERNGKL